MSRKTEDKGGFLKREKDTTREETLRIKPIQ